MQLMLEGIEKRVGGQAHLYPLDLSLVPGAATVLLGATQAGILRRSGGSYLISHENASLIGCCAFSSIGLLSLASHVHRRPDDGRKNRSEAEGVL